jgi:hypothetical protein
MEAAGHKPAAAQFEAKIDSESRRPPAANQQDRDLLRARLMSARRQDAQAEAIYKKWTAYWKTAALPDGMDPKESLQIRAVALTAYSHFLSVRGRSQEAQAVLSQLTALGCRFGTCDRVCGCWWSFYGLDHVVAVFLNPRRITTIISQHPPVRSRPADHGGAYDDGFRQIGFGLRIYVSHTAVHLAMVLAHRDIHKI